MRTIAIATLFLGACGGGHAPASSVRPAPAPAAPAPAPTAPRTETDNSVCSNRPDVFGPFVLDETQALRRYGIGARTFADAPSTKERPIEVCGASESKQWLRGAACADGSNAQEHQRIGAVGGGGRCGAIVDHYTVTCPERAYDVYIDMYMCGPGESMF